MLQLAIIGQGKKTLWKYNFIVLRLASRRRIPVDDVRDMQKTETPNQFEKNLFVSPNWAGVLLVASIMRRGSWDILW